MRIYSIVKGHQDGGTVLRSCSISILFFSKMIYHVTSKLNIKLVYK